jgi:hypothetical protein
MNRAFNKGLSRIAFSVSNSNLCELLYQQDETDAKLEALTMDVHSIHGEITSLKQGLHKFEEKSRLPIPNN